VFDPLFPLPVPSVPVVEAPPAPIITEYSFTDGVNVPVKTPPPPPPPAISSPPEPPPATIRYSTEVLPPTG